MEGKVRRLYELNWPKKAEVLELEVRRLMAEKKKIEEKYDKAAEDKSKRFPKEVIQDGISYLYNTGIVENTFSGYNICKN